MKEFSVTMSLVDFIPVVCFLIGAVVLQRAFYNKMSKGAFALFAAGTIDVFSAGFLKALYKLLYALKICDFEALNNLFMPLQSIGFLLAGISVIALISHKQGANTEKVFSVAAVPAVFKGTVVFIVMMVAGLAMMDFGFVSIAARYKKKVTVVMYIISFVCALMMGYLATKTFEKASLNWIAEGVNCIGQSFFMVASISLAQTIKKYGKEA